MRVTTNNRPWAQARSVVALALAGPLALGGTACRTGNNAASKIVDHNTPTLERATGQAKCGVKASTAKPLIVEWPAAERTALEGRMQRGLVAVRYEGCQMEVLTSCSVTGNYDFVSVTPKRETVSITSADELYANLPVGAAKLEAKLATAGSLNVDMMIIGRQETDRTRFTEDDLNKSTRCEGATHVVTGLTVGAFAFFAGGSAEVGGGVGTANVGIGAGSTASKEILNQDGDMAKCDEDGTTEAGVAAPPMGCGALLRVEVIQIEPRFDPSTGATTPTHAGGSAPADTGKRAGQNFATPELDKKIKTLRIVYLGSYVLAAGGIVTAVLGVTFARSAADPGLAGTDDRTKFIRNKTLGPVLLWTGIGAAAVFVGLAAWSSVRSNRLKNERKTRSAKVDFGVGGLQVKF